MNHLKNSLEFALSLKRPHKGQSVQTLIGYLLATLPDSYKDHHGNVHCTVGESRTLFSSHTDTVHRQDGSNVYIKAHESIRFKGEETRRVVYRAKDDPLGADCGAGVALMVHMVMNNVPGHYVFHAAEEVGGLGSTALAESGLFKGLFDRAIAFDRKATHSIITHQARGQCCSLEFANALADQLNDANDTFMYSPDATGVYTDTAEYVDQIPECTNVSVGYYHEHSSDEYLDFTHLGALANAVLLVKWEELPVGVIPVPVSRRYTMTDAFGLPYGVETLSAASSSGFGMYADDEPDEPDEALDYLWTLLDAFPSISDEMTIADIENVANVLGLDGVIALDDLVQSGNFSPRQFSDAMWDPQGFLNLVEVEPT